jgi:septum formation protein
MNKFIQNKLILASNSITRRDLLTRAGVNFTHVAPLANEEQLKMELKAKPVTAWALALAQAKSSSLAKTHSQHWVLGADQTLLLDQTVFSKPLDKSEATDHLRQLSGKTHILQSALAITRNGEPVWQYVDEARLTMRPLTDSDITSYLTKMGEEALHTVGCYQLEGVGVQLFEAIDGDYFTILGLPLLPLLGALRKLGLLQA